MKLVYTTAQEAYLSKDTAQIKNRPKQDTILDTISTKHNVKDYLNILKVGGSLVSAGLPAEPLPVNVFYAAQGRKSFSGPIFGVFMKYKRF